MDTYIYTNGTQLSADEQQAGRAAAQAVFDANGSDARECWEAQQEINAIDETAGHTIDSRTQMRACVWGEAESAAISAATRGWAHVPDDLSLGMP